MIEITANVRAFSGEGRKSNRIAVDGDTVRVWDSVAGHFTTCHLVVVHYRIVGFGPVVAPAAISTDREKTAAARQRACEADQSGYTTANTRIYGYLSRAQARAGDIGDALGKSGRIC
jgi:hypothetical protein